MYFSIRLAQIRLEFMTLLTYLSHAPAVGAGVEIAPTAVIVGKVSIAGPAVLADSAVLRGDQNRIDVGPRFRIGRQSTVHVELHTPTVIGADVWVGDDSVVHACTLGDGVRVEDGGLVLSTSSVGSGSIVAADSLVPEGISFPQNSYVVGTPGRRARDTTPEERAETLALIRAALGL
jgi:carbonic anhydrase/acetyltransferase-like protein (isoleucine patch superfamily)